MSTLSASFTQSPVETKRYVLDFTLQLAPGEAVSTVAVTVTQTGGPVVIGAQPLVVSSIALLPPVNGVVLGAAYFVSGGVDGNVYEAQFITHTSVGQILEDVVQYVLREKT